MIENAAGVKFEDQSAISLTQQLFLRPSQMEVSLTQAIYIYIYMIYFKVKFLKLTT